MHAQSHLILCDPLDCCPAGLLCTWDSPGKNTGVSCHAVFQGIFPAWGSNPHLLQLLHCRQILYSLSHFLYIVVCIFQGFPSGSVNKESACNTGDTGRHQYDLWVGKIPWRRAWQPTPVLLSGTSESPCHA